MAKLPETSNPCRRKALEDGENKVGHFREGKWCRRAEVSGVPFEEGLCGECEAGKMGDARWPGPRSSGLGSVER